MSVSLYVLPSLRRSDSVRYHSLNMSLLISLHRDSDCRTKWYCLRDQNSLLPQGEAVGRARNHRPGGRQKRSTPSLQYAYLSWLCVNRAPLEPPEIAKERPASA